MTFQLLGIPYMYLHLGVRTAETAHIPFKTISHFVNRSLAALRVYEIVLKSLSVIMHPEAKRYKTLHCHRFNK